MPGIAPSTDPDVPGPTGGSGGLDQRDLQSRAGALTLEQKVRLLTGADFCSLHAEPAAGLRRIVVSDGPAGVRGERWDERDSSANTPSPTALAASWDEALVAEIGGLLAFEARRKGVDVLLAPTLNLQRTPYGGRHFECFSEDPLLAAQIGVAFVRGVQSGGVAACAKHFIANDSETQRMTLDVRLDERTLRELYLPPFEAAVKQASVWTVMASHNRVNGQSMTESNLLRELLRGELGFEGLVMSDWEATRSTEASARAALDLVMPGPGGPWGAALLAAVRSGAVDEAAIDEKVLRLLGLAARIGALEGASAAPARAYDGGEIAALLRRGAAAGFVLVSNRDGLLPLDPAPLRRLAVIGANAASARTLGGGSATVFPPYTVSPLQGLRAALSPGVAVGHSPGPLTSARIPVARSPWLRTPDGKDGVEVRFVGHDGRILDSEHRQGCAFNWSRAEIDHDGTLERIVVRTVVRATQDGTYTVGASGIGHYRLSIGGQPAFDGRLEPTPGADLIEGLIVPPQTAHPVKLRSGQETDVVLVHEVGAAPGELGASFVRFQLNLLDPHGDDEQELARAAALAREVDVAVVVVGTTEEVESEGFDRASLALPGRQDELVARVAAANPNTIVVVNAGAPVLLPWADEVAAVLLAWFPGQEFGNALADVLLGAVEPGGRLPNTWPAAAVGLPSTLPVQGVLEYDERLRVGYRGSGQDIRVVRYPFGHGLGYSRWSYVSLEAPREAHGGEQVGVSVRLRNVGARRSREVVQLYARRPDSALERPIRWLVAFAGVYADPGEEVTVNLTLPSRAFAHWDVAARRWAVEPGRFELCAGTSSVALPLRVELELDRGPA